jgi:hypothetical protein
MRSTRSTSSEVISSDCSDGEIAENKEENVESEIVKEFKNFWKQTIILLGSHIQGLNRSKAVKIVGQP